MTDKLVIKTIPFVEWREGIAPLWLKSGLERFIPPMIEGGGQLQYLGRERAKSMVLFPLVAEYEGERVGWTSVFNISDEGVRIRGIYVLPEFRSNGIGYKIVHHALGLWPAPWKYAFMYARKSNVERYLRWGFETLPEAAPRSWSEGKMLGPGASEITLMRKALRA